MAELKVKSTFFAMEDKVEVDGVDEALAVGQRFEKVYVDALPEAVQTAIASHFDDTNKKITLNKSETAFVFENLSRYVLSKTNNTQVTIGTVNYEEYTNKDLNWKYGGSTGYFYLEANLSSSGSGSLNICFGNINYAEKSWKLYFSGASTWNKNLESNLEITVGDDYYSDIKQAIIKDLLANLGYVVIPSEETVDEKVAEVPNVEEAPSGTIASVLGLDSNGDVVKGTVSAGTKFYLHTIAYTISGAPGGTIRIVNNSNEPFTINSESIEATFMKYNIDSNTVVLKIGKPFPAATFWVVYQFIKNADGELIYDASDKTFATVSDTVTEL